MYKPIVMLIILGLIFPAFYAKDAGVFKKKARGSSNSEDSQDFWDFNPHADATGDILQDIKSGSKKSTMSDLEKILSTVEKTLSKMGATTTTERVLLESPASVTSEEEFILGSQNSENSQSEEQKNQEEQGEEAALPLGSSESTPSETSEEEESTSETSTETTPAETGSETENEEDVVPTTEEEESQPEEVSAGETDTDTDAEPDTETTPSVTFATQNSEFGTATLSASIEYDMAFSTFDQAQGKQTFINAISSLLGVEQSLVSVTDIREGSVIFDFEVTLPAGDQQTQDTSVTTLQAFASRLDDGAQDGSLDVFNGASILDFTRKVTVFGPTSEVENNPVSPKNDTLIAVLIIISAVVILGLVGFFVYKNKQVAAQTKAAEKEPKYKMSAKSEAERLDLENRGTTIGSRSSIGEIVGDKLKLFENSPPSDLTP